MTENEIKIIGNVLGLIAGLILLISGFPALRDQMKHGEAGTSGERMSRFLMGTGNTIWVISAFFLEAWSVLVMCAINAVIQFEIWRRMYVRNAKKYTKAKPTIFK